jgi:hypothetical protein
MSTRPIHHFPAAAGLAASALTPEEPHWDFTAADAEDSLDNDASESRVEANIFGPIPSNPILRARYMLLARYLQLSGNPAFGGDDDDPARKEKEYRRNLAIFVLEEAHQRITHQIEAVRLQIREIDRNIEHIGQEKNRCGEQLRRMREGRDAVAGKIDDVNRRIMTGRSELTAIQQQQTEENQKYRADKGDAQARLDYMKQREEEARTAFMRKFGLTYDAEKDVYVFTDEKNRRVVIDPKEKGYNQELGAYLNSSPEWLALERRRAFREFAEKRAAQVEIDHAEMKKAFDGRLTGLGDRLGAMNAEIERLEEERAKYDQQIAELNTRMESLDRQQADLEQKRQELQEQVDKLEEQKKEIEHQTELAKQGKDTIEQNLGSINSWRERRHTDRIANLDPAKPEDAARIETENQAYASYQLLYKAAMHVGGAAPAIQPAVLTDDFKAAVQPAVLVTPDPDGPQSDAAAAPQDGTVTPAAFTKKPNPITA